MKGVNGMEGMAGMKEGKKGVEGMGCVKGMGGGWGCDGKGFRKVCRVMDIEMGQGPKAKLNTTSVNHYWYTRTYK